MGKLITIHNFLLQCTSQCHNPSPHAGNKGHVIVLHSCADGRLLPRALLLQQQLPASSRRHLLNRQQVPALWMPVHVHLLRSLQRPGKVTLLGRLHAVPDHHHKKYMC
jgi:hypothetical protein